MFGKRRESWRKGPAAVPRHVAGAAILGRITATGVVDGTVSRTKAGRGPAGHSSSAAAELPRVS